MIFVGVSADAQDKDALSGAPLVACLDHGAKMNSEFFIEIAKLKPGIAFFRDDAFVDNHAGCVPTEFVLPVWPTVIEGVEINAEDVLVTRAPKAGLVVASEGAVVVGLETALTPELIAEGLAREFASHVQAMRKEADFEVTQRIVATVACDAEVQAALEAHRDYVMAETLMTALADAAKEADLNGHAVSISVSPSR